MKYLKLWFLICSLTLFSMPSRAQLNGTVNKFGQNRSSERKVSLMEWRTYRGFNINPYVTDSVLKTIIDETGANLIRLSFASEPFINKTAPYNFNEKAFRDLDRILNWSEKNSVKVVIDPHTTPGTRSNWTIYPEDNFWLKDSWHTYLIKLWVRIANIYKNRGDVIAGYDLLNEPAIPDTSLQLWNNLASVLIDTIRKIGDQHTIIVESAGRIENNRYIDRIPGIKELELPRDSNLVVSVHCYAPIAFTMQGVNNRPSNIHYPGYINGTLWDRNQLSSLLQPIRDFQHAHPGVPIFIGEFSASRAGGGDSNIYLKNLIDLFEEEGWSWAYHEFNGAPAWDPEMSFTSPLSNDQKLPRSQNASRMKILKTFYKRNKKN